MSIEIDVLNGGASWPMVEPLFKAVWPPDAVEKLPWAGIVFAHAELRVLVQAEAEGVVCHVGIYRREVRWNALLFCEPHNAPFYVGRGWKPFEGEIYAEQPAGRIRFDAIAPYVHDIRRAPRQGVIDLCGLPW